MKILINRIVLGIRSVFEYIRVMFCFNALKTSSYFNKNMCNVILSGTTFPARVKHFESCLKSVLLQTVRPEKIVIYLSRDEFPCGLPKNLEPYEKYNVEFIFVDGNARSYKKLIYSIEAFPHHAIITIDDDVYYPSKWLSELITVHNAYPEDVVFYRGHLIEMEKGNKAVNYEKIVYSNTDGIRVNIRFLPTGVCGILYPPGSLFSDYNSLEKINRLAPTADDIWFKAMAMLKNRQFRRVNSYNVLYPPVLGSQKFSLKKINVSSGTSRNDEQLKNTFDEYDLWERMNGS